MAHIDRVRTQRRWGVIATASGLGLALAGGAVGAWAQLSLPEVERSLRRAEQAYDRGGECDVTGEYDAEADRRCLARIADAEDRIDRRALLRTAGFVAAGVGAAVGAIGIVLLAGNDDEAKYDRVAASPWFAPGGGGVALRGRF